MAGASALSSRYRKHANEHSDSGGRVVSGVLMVKRKLRGNFLQNSNLTVRRILEVFPSLLSVNFLNQKPNHGGWVCFLTPSNYALMFHLSFLVFLFFFVLQPKEGIQI